MPRPQPGLAFYIVCDRGFAVGIVTHDFGKFGTLIWMAEPMFEEEPTVDDVLAIKEWRWPICFPVSGYLYRKVIIRIGIVPIPRKLKKVPIMRNEMGRHNWNLFKYIGTDGDYKWKNIGVAKDPTVPVDMIVNDIALKELLVSDWRPEHWW